MAKRLNLPRKMEVDFDGPIMDEYIDYCLNDVDLTWRIFVELRALYKQHDLAKPIHKIYSEASLGKGYFEAFGIETFSEKNKTFDPKIAGCFMEGFYGGRSDVRIRHKPTEVIHCDFKSQYPTVNALMGLQDLLLAEKIDVERGNDTEAKRFLEGVTLDDLQDKETWKRLPGVALVAPENDILPFRTAYTMEPRRAQFA